MINMSLTYVFSYVNENTNYNLRNKNNFNIIKTRINVRKKVFCSICIHVMNELPYDIRIVLGYKCFQSKVISLLTAQYL